MYDRSLSRPNILPESWPNIRVSFCGKELPNHYIFSVLIILANFGFNFGQIFYFRQNLQNIMFLPNFRSVSVVFRSPHFCFCRNWKSLSVIHCKKRITGRLCELQATVRKKLFSIALLFTLGLQHQMLYSCVYRVVQYLLLTLVKGPTHRSVDCYCIII